jgi:histidine triad (HIT) family protein
MPTIFTKIISGEIPCHKIMEDERFLAFLDIRPIHEGHTLVIPKQEVDYFFDIEDEKLGEILVFSKKVARKIKRVVACKKIGVMVAGLEVPHAHIHLVPINSVLDLNFANATAAQPEALTKIAEKIRNA